MQGKERNQSRIDGPFTDHAWMEMRKMLDLEMPANPAPVKGSRYKNYILLVLFLLLGFGAGVATMFYFGEESTPLEPVDYQQVKEVAALDVDSPFPNSSGQIPSSAMGGGGLAPDLDFGFSNSKTKSAKSVGTKSNFNQNSSITQNPNANSSLAIVPIQNANNLNPIPELKDRSLLENVDSGINQKHSDHYSDLMNPVDIYPTHSFSSPLLELIELDRKDKIRFGFRLGTYSRSFNDFAGVSSAVIASVPIDPSFTFEIGMQYSLLCGFQKNTDDSEINNTPFVVNSRDNRINLDYVSTIQPLGVNKELPIAKLHYIDLPVFLTYRPVQPIRIHMGIKASYLLHANADRQNRSANGANDPSVLEFRSDRDDALYESMKKFDFGTVLGFGYYPSKQFGVDIRYNHGLMDNTIDEVWQARQITTNKSFELTLTYFLSK